jgi:glyoxylase-like metal-dependent hydrolase (beta-lactamase superfamily II)/ferredoxin
MARLADRLPDNAAGEFYVDKSCIDCDTCRQVAPAVFGEASDHAFVHAQPANGDETRRALMALVSCPTSSIGTLSKLDVSAGVRALPELVTDGVYYCGYASESSFGASSWLIVRPEGNVLVDSPRAARPLMDRVAELGGVKQMFLTHADDVADHVKWARRFGCERVMHAADAVAGIEREIEDETRLADDLLIIPVPGHTRGSAALLYANRVLFTGDHLWGRADGTLGASRSVCWYSWSEQRRSIEKLRDYDFEWVLPGHGRRFGPVAATEMRAEIGRLLARMR